MAEGTADLEHREIATAARAQIGEERAQEVTSPCLLVGEIRRSAQGALALHEHAYHARAVDRRILPPGHGEHASVAQVLEAVEGLGHPRQDSNTNGRMPTPASPGRRAPAWRASGAEGREQLRPDGRDAGGHGAAGARP